jgi:hypothetical protein
LGDNKERISVEQEWRAMLYNASPGVIEHWLCKHSRKENAWISNSNSHASLNEREAFLSVGA